MTWDWLGCISVLNNPPDARMERTIEVMRKGEYFQVYVESRNHFRAQPDNRPDTWVMVESARKRGSFDELRADAESLRASHPTQATKLLRLRALNLALMHRLKNRGSRAEVDRLIGQEEGALKEVREFADSDRAALTACLGCYCGSLPASIVRNRQLADQYAKKHPDRIEGRLLLARALIKGEIYTVASPRGQKASGQLHAELGERGPKIAEGLALLEAAEQRFGPDPRIAYFRAQGLALAAAVADPKVTDVAALAAKAKLAALEVVRHGVGYPRLVEAAQNYLEAGKFFAFFPTPDE